MARQSGVEETVPCERANWLQSLRAYGLSLGEGEGGPELRQEAEIPVPMATGPLRQMSGAMLGMPQRARRVGLQDAKHNLVGTAK